MGGDPVALPVARGPAAGPRALQVVSGPLHARRAVSAAPAPAIPLKAGVSLGTCVSEGDDALPEARESEQARGDGRWEQVDTARACEGATRFPGRRTRVTPLSAGNNSPTETLSLRGG